MHNRIEAEEIIPPNTAYIGREPCVSEVSKDNGRVLGT